MAALLWQSREKGLMVQKIVGNEFRDRFVVKDSHINT
jgi:hypothetical protein